MNAGTWYLFKATLAWPNTNKQEGLELNLLGCLVVAYRTTRNPVYRRRKAVTTGLWLQVLLGFARTVNCSGFWVEGARKPQVSTSQGELPKEAANSTPGDHRIDRTGPTSTCLNLARIDQLQLTEWITSSTIVSLRQVLIHATSSDGLTNLPLQSYSDKFEPA